MCPLIYHFKKSHYIRVVQITQCINFSVNCFCRFLVVEVLLLISLDGHGIFGRVMHCSLDYGEGSSTNLQADFEVFNRQRLFPRILLSAFLDVINEVFKSRLILLGHRLFIRLGRDNLLDLSCLWWLRFISALSLVCFSR
jgi:hypothetical protein